MKKATIFCLITCALATNNTFGMLPRTIIARAKKTSSFYTDTKEFRVQQVRLILQRHEIKEHNNTAIKLMTEQNTVVDQLDEFDRPMIDLDYFLNNNKIADLAQKLLELEQQICRQMD